MKNIRLPERLIDSLTALGLLESEAKIYAALVLLEYADVGDLLEILDVSKPRIYTSLGTLEERGLIVQTSPRPAIYQAVAPRIALEMIVKSYEKAKEEAIDQFKSAKKLELPGKAPPPLYHVFGDKNVAFKIDDMLENAKEIVYCVTSEKYLGYLDRLEKKSVRLHLAVNANDPELPGRLAVRFKKCDATITVSDRSIIDRKREDARPAAQQFAGLMDSNSLFMLVTDDTDVLYVPPIKSDSLSAISVTSQPMVYMIRERIEQHFTEAEGGQEK